MADDGPVAEEATRPAAARDEPRGVDQTARADFRLRAGVVWANTYNKFDPTSPFGGYKESGFGREGGAAGLRPYLRVS